MTFGPFAWENVPALERPPVTQKLVYAVFFASDIGDLVKFIAVWFALPVKFAMLWDWLLF